MVCPELVTDGQFPSSTSAGGILHSISRHHPHKEIPEASWTSLYAVLCFHLAVLRFVYVYCQVRKLSSQVPCAFSGPIFSHLLVSYVASTTQEKLNELLLLPEGVPQWLISYGRQKQQHLRGQWLPVELGLSLLAHGILFEGKRRKSIVKLPIHSAITTHQQCQHKSYHLIQAKQTGGMFSALLSVRLSWNRNISQGKPTQH